MSDMNDKNDVDSLPFAEMIVESFEKDGFVEFSGEGDIEASVDALAKYASEREDVMFYLVRPPREVQTIEWGSPQIGADEEDKGAVYNVPGRGTYFVEEMFGDTDDFLFVMREF
jgi:hypothetical protein